MDEVRYLQIVKAMNLYSYHYHVLNDPLVSDEIYDSFYKELEQFEKDNPEKLCKDSVTLRVGDIDNKWIKNK